MVLIGKKFPALNLKSMSYLGTEKLIDVVSEATSNKKKVILVWYPKDFTNVCPTELNAFQEKITEFQDRNCIIIAASCDSCESHLAWLKNHNLAKSIQELSLYNFKTILKYKATWYGRDIVEVDRYFPSTKLCSCCGYKNNSLTLNDREWECPECKVVHDRDFNSSINIENEGRRILNIKEKIRLSSPESKPLENTTLVGSEKKEKNV